VVAISSKIPTLANVTLFMSRYFGFRRLPDLITKRWLGEFCPGEALNHDAEVRRRLIENR